MSVRDDLALAHKLVGLRAMRMRVAATRLAEATRLRERAEAERAAADATSAQEAELHEAAREDLAADPAEAELRLAVLDAARFRTAVAGQALTDARRVEDEERGAEAERRRQVLLANLRHDALADHARALARRHRRRAEARAANE